MNPDSLKLITETIIPAVGALTDLTRNIIAGARSLATARAELRSILAVADSRLAAFDAECKARDASEDERVAKLSDLTPTKP